MSTIDNTVEIRGIEQGYTVLLLGGSIGESSIRTKRQAKGLSAKSVFKIMTRDEAKAYAKAINKQLSPGEKKYYGLRYVIAEVKDGKYTGK